MNSQTAAAAAPTETNVNNHNRGSLPGKDSDEWRTPLRLVRAIERHFGIQFVADMAATPDNALCPIYFTKEEDALKQSSADVLQRVGRFASGGTGTHFPALWCNPPYGSTGLEPWMDYAKAVAVGTGLPFFLLVPASRCEQDWFYAYPPIEYHVTFLRRRVPFLRPDGTPGKAPNHPSFVIAFPGNVVARIPPAHFSHLEWKGE